MSDNKERKRLSPTIIVAIIGLVGMIFTTTFPYFTESIARDKNKELELKIFSLKSDTIRLNQQITRLNQKNSLLSVGNSKEMNDRIEEITTEASIVEENLRRTKRELKETIDSLEIKKNELERLKSRNKIMVSIYTPRPDFNNLIVKNLLENGYHVLLKELQVNESKISYNSNTQEAKDHVLSIINNLPSETNLSTKKDANSNEIVIWLK